MTSRKCSDLGRKPRSAVVRFDLKQILEILLIGIFRTDGCKLAVATHWINKKSANNEVTQVF